MATRSSKRSRPEASTSTVPITSTSTIKKEASPSLASSPAKKQRRSTKNSSLSQDISLDDIKPKIKTESPTKQSNADKKLNEYKISSKTGPFPNHLHPTPEEAEKVAWLLAEFHGYRKVEDGGEGLPRFRPPGVDAAWGGCGNVPDILEATIRTVLSCNTSNRNSTAAHKSMTEHFGRNNWQGMLDAPDGELVEAIRCGGLANNKSKTILGILSSTLERFGKLSLDHLHDSTEEEIMEVLLSFNGVGPKVASCVLAFCLGRESLAVDTHVFRLAKALNFVPQKANRDQTYYHLNERVPGHLKYPLHVLLIKHGKRCSNCSARGFATVKEEEPESDGGENEEKKDRDCPLKGQGLLGKTGGGGGGVVKGKAKAKGVKKEVEDEEGEVKPEEEVKMEGGTEDGIQMKVKDEEA